ncbi:DEKNAAC100489 [Brettanomyces naardenensis]|uniref:Pseudouridine synthase n=1 Tax=Brettanomyces naardenensis TaxID=13370 RepID=A0A448YFU1_BRENA|nr:DEKNAAC100489 [Brettanomyces naardenensis]
MHELFQIQPDLSWSFSRYMEPMPSIPEYVFRNGLRIVEPYYHIYRTTVKGRWFGRTVLQVLTDEFRDYGQDHYVRRILDDDITVLRKKKGESEVTEYKGTILMQLPLQSGDLFVHREHKHERPISDRKIEIIHNDRDLLVVNKPSGIPMHPVQGYLYNTLTEILKSELGLERLHPCNRLDRLTSGIVIICKNFESASYYQKSVQNHDFTKEYIARVDGKFPQALVECKDDVVVLDTKRKSDGLIRRDAETHFEVLKYSDSLDQSIVLCQPITGRTHQIRIHLRNVGHAIVNDPLYNPRLNHLLRHGGDVNFTTDRGIDTAEREQAKRRVSLQTGHRCPECGIQLYKEPDPESLSMYLHALRYTTKAENGEVLQYETPMPQWAEI